MRGAVRLIYSYGYAAWIQICMTVHENLCFEYGYGTEEAYVTMGIWMHNVSHPPLPRARISLEQSKPLGKQSRRKPSEVRNQAGHMQANRKDALNRTKLSEAS